MLDHPDAPWQPPQQLPPTADLRRGVAVLEQQLAGVDRKHAAFCVGKLISAFNERLTKEEASLRVEVWLEACGDIPADLWSAATIDLLRSWKRDDHYGRVPEPSDFRAAVEERLARRSTDLMRARTMLASANAAATRAAEPAGPIRHKPTFAEILEEQRNRPGLTDEQRLHVMAHTERSRAYTEKTPMADWAWSYFDERAKTRSDSAGAAMRTVVARNSPTGQRLAELAAAKREGRAPKPWHAGDPVYQAGQEEPPPHTDIPEGAAA